MSSTADIDIRGCEEISNIGISALEGCVNLVTINLGQCPDFIWEAAHDLRDSCPLLKIKSTF